MMSTVELSVIVPVFNEQLHLRELIDRCLATCRSTSRSFELILVDDGSRDQSAEIMRSAAETEAQVLAVILNRNYGQHAAVMAGFAHARGEVIVTLDADLQNPPEEIPRLLAEVDAGHDVVGTVRTPREDSRFRRLASAVANRAVQQATGVRMHDYGCMLRAYRRELVEAMLQCPERSTFIPVLANSFAGHPTEIAVGHSARQGDRSKYSLWKLVRLQFDLLTGLTVFPLQLLTFLGLVVSIYGLAFGVLLLVARLTLGAEWAAEGVFTLFAVLFLFVGLQFIAMGLLGEYVGRIYQDVRSRPRYFIQEVVGRTACDGLDDRARWQRRSRERREA